MGKSVLDRTKEFASFYWNTSGDENDLTDTSNYIIKYILEKCNIFMVGFRVISFRGITIEAFCGAYITVFFCYKG